MPTPFGTSPPSLQEERKAGDGRMKGRGRQLEGGVKRGEGRVKGWKERKVEGRRFKNVTVSYIEEEGK